MSIPTGIALLALAYALLNVMERIPRLGAFVIVPAVRGVLVRRQRHSARALIRAATGDRWRATSGIERRLLRYAFRDTMSLTVHRSLFPDVTAFQAGYGIRPIVRPW